MNSEITVHRFRVPVVCGTAQGEGKIYEDDGVLLLPASYSAAGEAVRLVINCHGAGGTVSTDDSQVEGQMITKYLLANGYAVMDVNGLPAGYSADAGIDIRNNIGSPVAMESYVRAYHYCVENFNLKREVLVHGGSMGGISSTNLVRTGKIPVIAHTAFCPVLDTYNEIFLHPWSDGAPKHALGIFYGLEKNTDGEWIYDAEKIAGYNPMEDLRTDDGAEVLSYPVPVKFFQCEDDGLVDIAVTKRFVAAVKASGGTAQLCTYPDGGHEPQDRGDAVAAPMGRTTLGGEQIIVRDAVEGVFAFLTSREKMYG
ncbi:MAG: alpha/beta hydrolase [Clostridia bacterium]|nr:alpha/beta hydrolase [Clostridia bacterium]